MLIGYAIIAVPTGIFTSNMLNEARRSDARAPLNCPQCARAGHEVDSRYCRFCGSSLCTDQPDEPDVPD
jgi:voltage-gated potassium channel